MGKQLPFCPVETTLTLINNKWKVIILRELMEGTKRFGELKKTVGKVSQKVLTSNLREMEEMDLLSRKVYAEVPPRVEYTLTETGYSLKPVLDAMSSWGVEYKKKKGCSLNADILGNNQDIAHVQNTLIMIDDVASALELMNTVNYETSCKKIIIYKSNLSEDFFKLSTGLADEIFEKYTNYHVKLAVIGDFSIYPNKALQNFISESNKGKDFFFVPTLEDAIESLS